MSVTLNAVVLKGDLMTMQFVARVGLNFEGTFDTWGAAFLAWHRKVNELYRIKTSRAVDDTCTIDGNFEINGKWFKISMDPRSAAVLALSVGLLDFGGTVNESVAGKVDEHAVQAAYFVLILESVCPEDLRAIMDLKILGGRITVSSRD